MLQCEDQRLEVSRIARPDCVSDMQNTVEEKCEWMDNVMLAFNDVAKKEMWKSYSAKLLDVENE